MTAPAPGKAELDRAGWLQTEHMADDAVTTAKITDDAVTAAKADTFLSSEITGVGSASPEAHGLGASPSMFFPLVTEHATSADLNMSATADATNVYINAAATTKYKVFAWL